MIFYDHADGHDKTAFHIFTTNGHDPILEWSSCDEKLGPEVISRFIGSHKRIILSPEEAEELIKHRRKDRS